MTSIHGLKHVKGFLAPHLADHDAVGTHTQTVNDELAHTDRAFTFNVGRASFEADYMLLLELQFSGIFDGDDALRIRDVSGENVENRGFAGARSSRDDQIEAALNHG